MNYEIYQPKPYINLFYAENSREKSQLSHFLFSHHKTKYKDYIKKVHKVSNHWVIPSLREGLALCITSLKERIKS